MKPKLFLVSNILVFFIIFSCNRNPNKLSGNYSIQGYFDGHILLKKQGEYSFKIPSIRSDLEKDFHINQGKWKKKGNTIILNSYTQPKDNGLLNVIEKVDSRLANDEVFFSISVVDSSNDSKIMDSIPPFSISQIRLTSCDTIFNVFNNPEIKVKWPPTKRKSIIVSDIFGLLNPYLVKNKLSNSFKLIYKLNREEKVKDLDCFIDERIEIVHDDTLLFRNSILFVKKNK